MPLEIIGSILGNAAIELVSKAVIPNENSSIDDVMVQAQKQEVSISLAEQQARVAQEIAIALRVVTADEVEIEEFYDGSGEANVGAKGNKEGISFGVGGSGRKIIKRIYKFKGYNEKNLEIYEQRLNDFLLKKEEVNKQDSSSE